MSLVTLLSKLDHTLRPALGALPATLFTRLYSSTRPWFSKVAAQDDVSVVSIPDQVSISFKHLTFRSYLGNAAGMYKQAEGYERAYAQGAGFYLCGTTTSLPRKGNTKHGILHPFVPYPKTHAASNWLGLPNDGHRETAAKIAGFTRFAHFPIGASIALDPGMPTEQAMKGLIEGMKAYIDAGCDFLELNESCPNVPGHDVNHSTLDLSLLARLDTVSSQIDLSSIPVFVKFSNDTDQELVQQLMKALIDRSFSGINFGNTSTRYKEMEHLIHSSDRHLYDYFTKEFGGGLSGVIVREASTALISEAKRYREELSVPEFMIIATGGIESKEDVQFAKQNGADLLQWYTGYYEQFGKHGNKVYSAMY